ncbi:MAG: hypothetical protein WCA23_13520 [Stellaceae bacterium]
MRPLTIPAFGGFEDRRILDLPALLDPAIFSATLAPQSDGIYLVVKVTGADG